MSEEPLIAVQHVAAIDAEAPGLERAAPSPEQQRASDDVFTDDQGRAIAALMALQTGVGLAHLIADNARTEEEPKKVPPRELRKE